MWVLHICLPAALFQSVLLLLLLLLLLCTSSTTGRQPAHPSLHSHAHIRFGPDKCGSDTDKVGAAPPSRACLPGCACLAGDVRCEKQRAMTRLHVLQLPAWARSLPLPCLNCPLLLPAPRRFCLCPRCTSSCATSPPRPAKSRRSTCRPPPWSSQTASPTCTQVRAPRSRAPGGGGGPTHLHLRRCSSWCARRWRMETRLRRGVRSCVHALLQLLTSVALPARLPCHAAVLYASNNTYAVLIDGEEKKAGRWAARACCWQVPGLSLHACNAACRPMHACVALRRRVPAGEHAASCLPACHLPAPPAACLRTLSRRSTPLRPSPTPRTRSQRTGLTRRGACVGVGVCVCVWGGGG